MESTSVNNIDINHFGPQVQSIIQEAFKTCVHQSERACQRNYIPAIVMAVLIFNALVFFGNKLGRNFLIQL
ncbi:conserved Plasmodium protein, unknown function [Plasmodium knowlesi strain H]|uniref:Uncharacterized protein n=3 Tax=Plasmodium knowlesi TaxID=5850 RepID=A0A5K1UWC0_PLAKH|nr:conserved Plasmodium protein, unknown function [Plasmodium knowlesi strain H]OTN64759.1 Uncharacterized protein PKNOH_S130215600 [Plasmodium knowlesi]CAA9989316.1 conserved Plasmodium protein, unknown function [Plasmodium knowlesi strain H]SBO26109.1 conserved Plasmodium protein, unknown function [Plasmodium knowlesi strain H]SBO26763.1 conserved Plasmodium protein, unknown function [Plasmodium knowlesi strain H]VVS78790.1 conserved Plasmodium protein, unknown function [Plasmodium knowlesi |eukprot:XP_002261663.1 hypothetical protein, conserved in Plasmodium species [Plasmodium knowlesi strain H]